jgi:branched-chain amino acid transport system substrate-binding protein
MEMNLKKGLVGLLATTSLLVAACGNSGGAGGEAANEDGEVTLGTVFAITGAVSAYGTPQENAINMAINEINEDGGVLDDQEIELVNYDYTSVDTEAAQLATRLATQDNVDAIFGADTSGAAKNALQSATQHETPILSPSASADNYTEANDGNVEEWGWRVAFPDSYQGGALAQFADQELGAENVAILMDNSSDYSIGLVEFFEETFPGEVVAKENFTAGQTDFNATLTSLNEVDFDVLLVTGYYEEGGPIVRQAREMGLDQPILAPDGFGNQALVELAGPENLNDVYYTTQFTTLNENPLVDEFVANYTEEYGTEPDMFAAMAYDAAYVMRDAIERAGSDNRQAINDALAETENFEGVTGTFSYDEMHNPSKEVTILELQNGEPVDTFIVDPDDL